MTTLQLDVRQPHALGFLDVGAVATVRLLADLDGHVVDEWWQRDQPVAVAGQGQPPPATAVFDLPRGGYYGVEVTLPRGEDLVRQVRIDEGETRVLAIDMKVSPHEYLAWQQFAGVVRSNPYITEQRETPIDRTEGRRVELLVESRQGIDRLYEGVHAVPTVWSASVPSDATAWARVGAPGASSDRTLIGVPTPGWDAPRWEYEFATWFHAMPETDEGLALVRGLRGEAVPESLQAKFPRWMAFETDGGVDLASVPWAWWGGMRQPDEEIAFFYDRVRPSQVEPRSAGHVRLSVHDHRWFALLEFIGSGRLIRARSMFDAVLSEEYPEELYGVPEAALYGKTKGPLVATVGAIMLVAGAQSEQPQYWDRWLQNLANWFPGIPDGAMLLGCRRAAQARDAAALERAFELLREGIERGIPFLSATMRLAAIALARIGDAVPAADDALRTIAQVSSRVDPEQPFTVIRLR